MNTGAREQQERKHRADQRAKETLRRARKPIRPEVRQQHQRKHRANRRAKEILRRARELIGPEAREQVCNARLRRLAQQQPHDLILKTYEPRDVPLGYEQQGALDEWLTDRLADMADLLGGEIGAVSL